MKKAFAMFCVAACFSTPIRAQEDKKPSTDVLVKTAAESKAKRKKSSTKVITNKDVKKARGKLIVLDNADDKTVKPAAKDTTSALQKQDATFRQRRDATDRITAAQKKVDGLQKELDTLEQNYYAENDPNYRDKVIQERFGQTKRQLEDAQRDLANARDALQKLTPSTK
jgi:hypothetical protein